MIHEYLDNGVEVVIKEDHFAQAVAIQCWAKVGAIHESAGERGMAHFIEHMLFKGTPTRQVGEIAATVEACGGDINAYTTFDHTVFYLTMASPHAAFGVDLLADAVFNSSFDPDEFEREKEVILEEIRRGNDNPGARVGRRVFELRYAGTEAGRPIIGSEESVRSFRRDDLRAFYKKWYQPQNLAVVIAGDCDERRMLDRVKELFGSHPRQAVPAQPTWTLESLPARPASEGGSPIVSLVRGDYKQHRVEMVFPTPGLEHPDNVALDLASFALGSGEMSRLNRRLRDTEGVVTMAGSSVFSPRFGGVFEMSALAPEDGVRDAVQGLSREVAKLVSLDPVTEEELARARANLKADRIYRDETVEGQARSLGSGLRTSHKLMHDEVFTSLVNEMPPDLVDSAVRRWLQPDQAVLVALLPEDHPVTEEELRAAFHAGIREGTGTADAAPQAVAPDRAAKPEPETQKISIKDGVSLIYRRKPEAKHFTLTAGTEGGLRAESGELAGYHNAMAGLLGTAATTVPFESLVGEVEGLGATLEGFSGKDSFGFSLQCLEEHTQRLLELWSACLREPVFPDEQWESLHREIQLTLAAQNDSPASQCLRRFQELLFGDHPYRFPVYGTEASAESMTAERLTQFFCERRDGGPWVLAAVGSAPADEVAAQVREALDGFSPSSEPRRFSSDEVSLPGPGADRLQKEREQTHVLYGYPGLTWGDPQRAALDVIVNVLGGQGGRLFVNLRDRQSLAYSVSPVVTYGCHPGAVGSYIACAPDKAEAASEALKKEMERICEEPPAEDELQRAKAYLVGSHDLSLQRSEAQTSTMALMELYGYGHDDFLRYPERVANVSREETVEVARRLFQEGRAVSVTVGP